MRLLLTRAAQDSARTRAKLEGLGHRVIESPVIDIVDTGAVWPGGVVDAVLATSGQALIVLAARPRPSPEARRLMPLFLVGERTAAMARRAGFAGPATVAPNVASLAIALGKVPALPSRLLYLAGRDRKPDLETALDVMGQTPEVIEVYEAKGAEALTAQGSDALARGTLHGVVHFSRRSADLFLQLAEKAERDVRPLIHFCLSTDVAQPLELAGCADVRVSEEPSEASVLDLIGTV